MSSLEQELLTEAQRIHPEIIAMRREIHRWPELAFQVQRTAALVADKLTALGVEVRTSVGKTGVVGTLGKPGGPVVAIRADMDALPIQEENQVDYASQVPGCMHACGHDAHTAMLLGVARLLAPRQLPGQVRLLFQPSEETFDEQGNSGATCMLADGALEGVSAVIALHVDSDLPSGHISISPGVINAAVDTFRGVIRGKGGHGAYPHQTVDPFWLTAQILNAMYAVPSRRIDPTQPCVLTVGILRGGTAENVIPDAVEIEGTLRSMDDTVRQQLCDQVQGCLEIARTLGGDYQLIIDKGYPCLENDPGVAETIRNLAVSMIGADRVHPTPPSMGAEDFSYMTRTCPGAMFELGVTPAGETPRRGHNAKFDVDESALPVGAALLASTALRLLEQVKK